MIMIASLSLNVTLSSLAEFELKKIVNGRHYHLDSILEEVEF